MRGKIPLLLTHWIARRCNHFPSQVSLAPTWGEKIRVTVSRLPSLRDWGPETSQSPLGKFPLIFLRVLFYPPMSFLIASRCLVDNPNSHFLKSFHFLTFTLMELLSTWPNFIAHPPTVPCPPGAMPYFHSHFEWKEEWWGKLLKLELWLLFVCIIRQN